MKLSCDASTRASVPSADRPSGSARCPAITDQIPSREVFEGSRALTFDRIFGDRGGPRGLRGSCVSYCSFYPRWVHRGGRVIRCSIGHATMGPGIFLSSSRGQFAFACDPRKLSESLMRTQSFRPVIGLEHFEVAHTLLCSHRLIYNVNGIRSGPTLIDHSPCPLRFDGGESKG